MRSPSARRLSKLRTRVSATSRLRLGLQNLPLEMPPFAGNLRQSPICFSSSKSMLRITESATIILRMELHQRVAKLPLLAGNFMRHPIRSNSACSILFKIVSRSCAERICFSESLHSRTMPLSGSRYRIGQLAPRRYTSPQKPLTRQDIRRASPRYSETART